MTVLRSDTSEVDALPFVYETFVRSYGKYLPADQRRVWEQDAQTLVPAMVKSGMVLLHTSCNVPDQIYGWLACCPGGLVWAYTKHPYRRTGVCGMLLTYARDFYPRRYHRQPPAAWQTRALARRGYEYAPWCALEG